MYREPDDGRRRTDRYLLAPAAERSWTKPPQVQPPRDARPGLLGATSSSGEHDAAQRARSADDGRSGTVRHYHDLAMPERAGRFPAQRLVGFDTEYGLDGEPERKRNRLDTGHRQHAARGPERRLVIGQPDSLRRVRSEPCQPW